MVAATAAAALLPLWAIVGAILCRRKKKDPVAEIMTEAVRRISIHPKPAMPKTTKWKPADVYRHQADAWTGGRETPPEPELEPEPEPEPPKAAGKSKWKCSDVYKKDAGTDKGGSVFSGTEETSNASSLLGKREGSSLTTVTSLSVDEDDPPPPYVPPMTPGTSKARQRTMQNKPLPPVQS
ncbi:uncharacterized protein LOC135498416 [Lineus longissimus]|uniref:uncharacterized protein LOC135498416 n=1 Tax=Lineus longissimus TaxID=88925 RepID=UPI002B4EC0E0